MSSAVCAKSRTVAGSPLMSTSGSEMPSFIIALQCRAVSRKPKPDFTRAPSDKMRCNTDVDRSAGVGPRVRVFEEAEHDQPEGTAGGHVNCTALYFPTPLLRGPAKTSAETARLWCPAQPAQTRS